MRNNNRSNVLLVEILIAVLFFMLSATVLVQVFAGARNLTVRSGIETAALIDAQNVAEALYASEDEEAALTEMGFINSHGSWTKGCGDYSLYVVYSNQKTDGGELWQGEVKGFLSWRDESKARQEDEELFSLPCTKYREGRS